MTVISRDLAERQGYTLSLFGDCLRRLTINESTLRRALGSQAQAQLPSVRVAATGRGSGHPERRVRPEDLESFIAEVSSPAPLPSDAMSLIQAVRFLADKPELSASRGTAGRDEYVLWCHRIRGMVNVDRALTEYKVLGVRRYSRAELETVKAAFDEANVTGRPSRKRARAARVALAATTRHLIDTAETSRIAGVKRATVRDRWGPAGRYGAEKIGGCWYFDRAQVESRKRATPGRSVPISCSACGKQMSRTPSRIRKTRRPYCGDCWRRLRMERLRQGIAEAEPDELFRRRSEAQQRSWADGHRDTASYSARAKADNRLVPLHRKPTVRVKRIDRMMQTRFGYGLSDERKREILANARRDAQLSSERSRGTRKLKAQLCQLWSTDSTQMQIAHELHVTPGRIAQLAQEMDLPPRPLGRRRRNV